MWYKFTKENRSRKMVELEENTIFISNSEGITIAKLSNERVAISLFDMESNKKIIRIIKSKNPYELIKDI